MSETTAIRIFSRSAFKTHLTLDWSAKSRMCESYLPLEHGEQPTPSAAPSDWNGKVLHARMSLGGTELLGADIPAYEPMRSAYLSLTVDSDAEADRVYGLLSDGGQVFMQMQETFFASRFAMLRDRFGTSWMLLHPKAQSASAA